MKSISDLSLKPIIGIIVAVVVVCAVMIPLIDSATHTPVDKENEGYSDIELGYIDLSKTHDNKTVTVTYDGTNVTLSGDYSKTVGNEDQIIMVSDTNALFMQDGSMYYTEGASDTRTVTEMTLTVLGNTVNSSSASWVYFPVTDGGYGSYNHGFEYDLSDMVAVGMYAGYSAISDNTEVLTDDVLGATVVKDDEGYTNHVHYEAIE